VGCFNRARVTLPEHSNPVLNPTKVASPRTRPITSFDVPRKAKYQCLAFLFVGLIDLPNSEFRLAKGPLYRRH
jgi:hypothetical protein